MKAEKFAVTKMTHEQLIKLILSFYWLFPHLMSKKGTKRDPTAVNSRRRRPLLTPPPPPPNKPNLNLVFHLLVSNLHLNCLNWSIHLALTNWPIYYLIFTVTNGIPWLTTLKWIIYFYVDCFFLQDPLGSSLKSHFFLHDLLLTGFRFCLSGLTSFDFSLGTVLSRLTGLGFSLGTYLSGLTGLTGFGSSIKA